MATYTNTATGGFVSGSTLSIRSSYANTATGGARGSGVATPNASFRNTATGGARPGSISKMSISNLYDFELVEDFKTLQYHPLNIAVPNKQIRNIVDENGYTLFYFYRYRDDTKMKMMIKLKTSNKITIDVIKTQELG